jgi:NADH:ubiquinone reductase (H+-translocating)
MTRVIIVGAGFAGVACAKRLAGEPRVQVTVLDSAGYHQFQPLPYQVATAELAPEDIRFNLAAMFARHANIDARTAEVVAVDPHTPAVTLADNSTVEGDVLVLGVGAQPNYFHTAGADEFAVPLYSLNDAERVRSRLLELFRDAAAKPELVEEGALTFVVVGAGPTGVETAGAIAELAHDVMPHVYPHLATAGARVILVDLGHTVLPAFSDEAHTYAVRQLQRRGVQLRLGVPVKEVAVDSATRISSHMPAPPSKEPARSSTRTRSTGSPGG